MALPLEQVTKELEEIERVASEMSDVYLQAKSSLKKIINDLERDLFAQGTPSKAVEEVLSQQRALLRDIERVITKLSNRSVIISSDNINRMYRKGMTRLDSTLRATPFDEFIELDPLNFDLPVSKFASIHQQAVIQMIRGVNTDIIKAHAGIVNRYRKMFAEQHIRGIALRKSVDEFATALRNEYDGNDFIKVKKTIYQTRDKKVIAKAEWEELPRSERGRPLAVYQDWEMEKFGEMVIRTTSASASTEATLNRLSEFREEYPETAPLFDLVQVTKHPLACPLCQPFESKVFSQTGAWNNQQSVKDGKYLSYPLLSETPNGGPPFHPNCRHDIASFSPLLHRDLAENNLKVGIDKQTLKSVSMDKDERKFLGKDTSEIYKMQKESGRYEAYKKSLANPPKRVADVYKPAAETKSTL